MDRIHDFTQPPIKALVFLNSSFSLGTTSLFNVTELFRTFAALITAEPVLDSIFIGSEDGSACASFVVKTMRVVFRVAVGTLDKENATSSRLLLVKDANSSDLYVFPYEGGHVNRTPVHIYSPFDPRDRPWYSYGTKHSPVPSYGLLTAPTGVMTRLGTLPALLVCSIVNCSVSL